MHIEKSFESLQTAALLLSCASFGILILGLKSIERTVQESEKLLLLAEKKEISWEITAADGIFSAHIAFNSKLMFSMMSNNISMISPGRISDGNLPQVLREVSFFPTLHWDCKFDRDFRISYWKICQVRAFFCDFLIIFLVCECSNSSWSTSLKTGNYGAQNFVFRCISALAAWLSVRLQWFCILYVLVDSTWIFTLAQMSTFASVVSYEQIKQWFFLYFFVYLGF